MATYKFEQFKVTIKNPALRIVSVFDDYNGGASVDIELSLGSVNNKNAVFGVRLNGFTYTDEWTTSDIEAWVNTKLTEYEI